MSARLKIQVAAWDHSPDDAKGLSDQFEFEFEFEFFAFLQSRDFPLMKKPFAESYLLPARLF